MTFKCGEMYKVFDDADKLISFIENYVPDGGGWQKLKIGD